MLTRFEKARVIGARSLQLAAGAPVLVKITKKGASLISIVEKEMEEDVLPISVVRHMPDGSQHVYNLSGEIIE